MDIQTTYYLAMIITAVVALGIYKFFVEDKKKK